MNKRLKTILSDLRRELEGLYGARLTGIVLFGSQARGDAEPGSDIDVLVVLKGDVRPGVEVARTGDVVAELSLAHNVVVSTIFMSSDRYAVEQSPLLLNVRREGVQI